MVPAVSGRHIDGTHSYRFDKAFLTQWQQQRMTSKEVAEWLGISKPTLHRWFAKEEILGYNKASSRNDSVPAGCSALAQ